MIRKTAFVVLALSLTGCVSKRYFGRGLVLDVNRGAQTVTVSHDRIPGYMEPMVMPFTVRDSALLKGVRRGDRIHFHLAVEQEQSYLDHLMVVSASPVQPAKRQSRALSEVVSPGEQVPDFALKDQNGEPVSLSQFRGKVVAITFIYTRCPLPDYCPRMTGNFVSLRERFHSKLGKDLILMNVTLDPQYDTPEVMHTYAKRFNAVAQGWYFLTGTNREVARVCGSFGVEYWPDDGILTHNLQTGLIDRKGQVAANIEGKDYSAKQLGDLVEQLLQK